MSTNIEERKENKKIDAIIDYFKLLYIEDISKDKSMSAFKMLNGDLLLEKVFEADSNRLISLDSTNYMLVQDLQLYVSKYILLENDNSFYIDLDWISEIIGKIPADEKAIETIAKFLPYNIYEKVLEKHSKLPMPKERIMQKRINEISKIVKTEENN